MPEKIIKYVPMATFSITVTIFAMVIGWLFYASGSTSAKVDNYMISESETQATLKEIQTDIKWIIKSHENK